MKHLYIRMSEDEFTDCKEYGIWELEQDVKPLILKLIESKKEQRR